MFSTRFIPVFGAFILFQQLCFAATGDTVKIRAHNKVAMTWYGNYDTLAVFPPATQKFNRMIMHYTLGCPTTGCSQWDYTTQIFLMKKTGAIDSTLKQLPSFTVNNVVIDTFVFSRTRTLKTVFNTTSKLTDTIPADSSFVRVFADAMLPTLQTDSFWAWNANFTNYIWDTSGARIDSFWMAATDTFILRKTDVYEKFPVLEPYELARVITPYGGYYNKNWTNQYRFDVTDFAPLLHDTVQLRAFYSGWSSGFTVTLDFDLIEGTPTREVRAVRNIYNGDFNYGDPNNPIENKLSLKNIVLANNETQAKLRFTPTGHGFGADNTDNCAEFCDKTYDVMLNNTLVATQHIWRDDCGMNPLFHQSGTWLFDRANWCPGDKGLTHEFELTPFISANNFSLQVVPEPYEDLNPAGFNPIYTIYSQLITYGANNFFTDAAVEDVIAPNTHDAYKRFNPICANPKIIIKNNGANPLTSARIYYGIEGKELFFFEWSGMLLFNQTEVVSLPYRVISDSLHKTFKVWISNPNNNGSDEFRWNDTLRVQTSVPPRYDSEFNFVLKTNNDFAETSWWLKNDDGDVLYENGTLAANKVYTQKFELTDGCYQFALNDDGKDGLSFFANQQTSGTGYARFTKYPSNSVIKILEPDFGTQITQQFIVGNPEIFVPSKTIEILAVKTLNVFPNPAQNIATLELALQHPASIHVELQNILGENVKHIFSGFGQNFALPVELQNCTQGIYFIVVTGENFKETKLISVIR